ncbi:MAG TPA: FG-GAP repeat protein, partial [Gemmata sp.]|nr:FG-GAP repeat protein [Gemmata sp.]
VTNSAMHGANGGTGATSGDGGDAQGGGIYIAGGTAVVANSTIAKNLATIAGTGATNGDAQGGGIFNAGTLDLENSTVADNSSDAVGGGIRNEGTLTLVSTLIGRNTSVNTTEEDLSDPGAGTTASFSLIQSANGHTITNGVNNNLVGVDPKLGTLVAASNGNGTFVIHLLAISPARNKGSNPGSFTQDQEGNPRTLGKQTDIGAIEENPIAVVLVSTGNGVVRVVDANTGTVYQSFRPFDTANSKYTGLMSVAVGDVNGDGFADIIVATRGLRNGRVKVFDGYSALVPGVNFNDPSTWTIGTVSQLGPAGGPALTDPLFGRVSPYSGYKGGLTVAATDVNNDGFADIIIGSRAFGSDTNGNGVLDASEVTTLARVSVFSGADLTQRIGNVLTPFGNAPASIYVAGGDVNGDNNGDLILSTSINSSKAKVFQLVGGSFAQLGSSIGAFGTAAMNTQNGSGQVSAVDVNGDGISEFAISIMDSKGVKVRIFDGTMTQVTAYTIKTGAKFYGLGAVDANEDGLDQVMLGLVPAGANQIQLRNAMTGVVEGGFNAFPSLVGSIALDGV